MAERFERVTRTPTVDYDTFGASMKRCRPLHVFLLVAMTTASLIPSLPSHALAPTSSIARQRRSRLLRVGGGGRTKGSTVLRYKSSFEPLFHDDKPDDDQRPSSDNVWTALTETAKWMSETAALASSSSSESGVPNPYATKAVSYVSEPQQDVTLVVSGIFRRLREARELGELHMIAENRKKEKRKSSAMDRGGPEYAPKTLRQTEVVVIPSCDALTYSFETFDDIVMALDQAYLNARDYDVIDASLEKLHEAGGEVKELDWIVNVSCDRFHPKFGETTSPKDTDEIQGEADDVNFERAYQRRRRKLGAAARQSPFPSVVVEVKASPTTFPSSLSPKKGSGRDENLSNNEDVRRLEALLGLQTTAFAIGGPSIVEDAKEQPGGNDDSSYDSLKKTLGANDVSPTSPLNQAQKWIAEHDQGYVFRSSTFATSDTKYADSAYEFVFSTIGMMQYDAVRRSGYSTGSNDDQDVDESSSARNGCKQYLIMPNFLASSATGFEIFALEVGNIIRVLPGYSNKVAAPVLTYHPQHVERERRSPVPILVLSWDI